MAIGVSLVLVTTLLAGSGPNQAGFLVFHTDDSVEYSSSYGPFCDAPVGCPRQFGDQEFYGFEDDCQHWLQQVNPTSLSGQSTCIAAVWAVFWPGTNPRVSAVSFGLAWDDSNPLTIVDYGHCGQFELASPGWPKEPHTGTAVTWDHTFQSQCVPVYWFAAYSYYGPLEVELTPHPRQGGWFADDSVPAVLDEISGYGSLGLNGASGQFPYYHSPVVEQSWGQVKRAFAKP